MTFYVSPSGLTIFFNCPAQFRYKQQWKSLAPTPQFFLDGTHAHQAMEGTMNPESSRASDKYFERLHDMEKDLGYEVLHRELRQKVPLGNDIMLVRVIDAVVLYEGVPMLVDYKTATWPWRRLASGIAPKGSGFQPAAYLIPPEELPEGLDEWPTRIAFLVAAKNPLSQHLTTSLLNRMAESSMQSPKLQYLRGQLLNPLPPG